MKAFTLVVFLMLAGMEWTNAQTGQDSTRKKNYTPTEQEIVDLSKTKWQWMSDKNVESKWAHSLSPD